jgi:hypothetical protein
MPGLGIPASSDATIGRNGGERGTGVIGVVLFGAIALAEEHVRRVYGRR